MQPEKETVTIMPVSSNEVPVIVTNYEMQKLIDADLIEVKAKVIRDRLLWELAKDVQSYIKSGEDVKE